MHRPHEAAEVLVDYPLHAGFLGKQEHEPGQVSKQAKHTQVSWGSPIPLGACAQGHKANLPAQPESVRGGM